MFWSGQTLESSLDRLIFDESGRAIGSSDKIDCSAYTLTIGPEIFITPDKPSESKKGHQKIRLQDREDFVIPKGQFVFLLTEEYVKIPDDCIAFISLKTRSLKFKGLINVSGFHVDPGYHGRILYSIFNAGPQDITLHRGQDFAMIWFAFLDKVSEYKYRPGLFNKEISTDITGPMNGEVFSPVVVKERLDRMEHEIERQKHLAEAQTAKQWNILLGTFLIGLLLVLATIVGDKFKDDLFPPTANPTSVSGGEKPLSIQDDDSPEKAKQSVTPTPSNIPEPGSKATPKADNSERSK